MPLSFVIIFLSVILGRCAQYTNATSLELQTSLTNSAIVAGDTVWLRGGTYSNSFISNIGSTSSNSPIIFRNHPGERAIIDGVLTLNNSTSSNIWFWGLEVVDSNKASRSNPFDTISNGGPGVKFINCLIHDCCIGLAGGAYEASGNIMWNCGKVSTEHAIYWQNVGTIPKLMENNLIGWSGGFGIHCYSQVGLLNNLRILGNTIWESGQPLEPKQNILLGGGTSVTNGLIDGNDCFGSKGVEVGYGIDQNHSVTIINNRLYGGRPLEINKPFTTMTVTNNVTMHNDDANVYVDDPVSLTGGAYIWDYNTYLCARFPGHSFITNFVNLTFPEWTNAFGFDVHSTYTETATANFINQVIVKTNRYEAKRAHVVVWNFGGSNTITADLSGVLTAGDAYEVRNAMNYFGEVVASGTYSSGSITLPMTNLTVAPTLYWTPDVQPANITTNFAAFVVMGASPASILKIGTLYLPR